MYLYISRMLVHVCVCAAARTPTHALTQACDQWAVYVLRYTIIKFFVLENSSHVSENPFYINTVLCR